MNGSVAANSIWIKNSTYDLAFIFGGSLLAVILPLSALLSPAILVPIFFWGWVFFFEGSHFWATYSRTYLDSKFRTEQQGVLTFSLIFLLLPLIAVGLFLATGNSLAMGGYGFFIFTWSLYHNTRQHYGFVSIYNRKVQASEVTMKRFRSALYLVTYAPMAHFFLSYKLGGDFPVFFNHLSSFMTFRVFVLNVPWCLSVVSALYLLWIGFQMRGSHGGKGSPVAFAYLVTCFLFYHVMFFFVAPHEPFFPSAENFAQRLMMISIMNSIFHNIQYHAMVWFYSRKRYAQSSQQGFYGWANTINSRFLTYALTALTFSAGFTLVFWLRGEIPFLPGMLSTGNWNLVAFVIYFGVVGQHFYLDQKIWRVSRTPELIRYLALTPKLA